MEVFLLEAFKTCPEENVKGPETFCWIFNGSDSWPIDLKDYIVTVLFHQLPKRQLLYLIEDEPWYLSDDLASSEPTSVDLEKNWLVLKMLSLFKNSKFYLTDFGLVFQNYMTTTNHLIKSSINLYNYYDPIEPIFFKNLGYLDLIEYDSEEFKNKVMKLENGSLGQLIFLNFDIDPTKFKPKFWNIFNTYSIDFTKYIQYSDILTAEKIQKMRFNETTISSLELIKLSSTLTGLQEIEVWSTPKFNKVLSYMLQKKSILDFRSFKLPSMKKLKLRMILNKDTKRLNRFLFDQRLEKEFHLFVRCSSKMDLLLKFDKVTSLHLKNIDCNYYHLLNNLHVVFLNIESNEPIRIDLQNSFIEFLQIENMKLESFLELPNLNTLIVKNSDMVVTGFPDSLETMIIINCNMKDLEFEYPKYLKVLSIINEDEPFSFHHYKAIAKLDHLTTLGGFYGYDFSKSEFTFEPMNLKKLPKLPPQVRKLDVILEKYPSPEAFSLELLELSINADVLDEYIMQKLPKLKVLNIYFTTITGFKVDTEFLYNNCLKNINIYYLSSNDDGHEIQSFQVRHLQQNVKVIDYPKFMESYDTVFHFKSLPQKLSVLKFYKTKKRFFNVDFLSAPYIKVTTATDTLSYSSFIQAKSLSHGKFISFLENYLKAFD